MGSLLALPPRLKKPRGQSQRAHVGLGRRKVGHDKTNTDLKMDEMSQAELQARARANNAQQGQLRGQSQRAVNSRPWKRMWIYRTNAYHNKFANESAHIFMKRERMQLLVSQSLKPYSQSVVPTQFSSVKTVRICKPCSVQFSCKFRKRDTWFSSAQFSSLANLERETPSANPV